MTKITRRTKSHKTIKPPKWMVIECTHCKNVMCIDPTKRYKLWYIDCPKCWTSNNHTFLIIWQSNKIIHDIDLEVDKQGRWYWASIKSFWHENLTPNNQNVSM